jgi:hypothetical protein
MCGEWGRAHPPAASGDAAAGAATALAASPGPARALHSGWQKPVPSSHPAHGISNLLLTAVHRDRGKLLARTPGGKVRAAATPAQLPSGLGLGLRLGREPGRRGSSWAASVTSQAMTHRSCAVWTGSLHPRLKCTKRCCLMSSTALSSKARRLNPSSMTNDGR